MPESMNITVERAEDVGTKKGGFGIAVEERKDSAWVGYTVGKAKEADVIKKGDKITHVDGKGPLKCTAVCEALKAAESKAELTIIRGEKVPSRPTSIMSVMSICTLVMLVCAMSWPLLDLPAPDALLAQMDGYLRERADALDLPAAARAGGGGAAAGRKPSAQPRGGPALRVNGKEFHLHPEDGTAPDPQQLRAAMRADKGFMDTMREQSPDWARIVMGGSDGSFDEEAFQKLLRKNFEMYQKDLSVKLNEDGSAKDPAAYLKTVREDKKWMKMLNSHPDTELREEILKGNPEALNRLLMNAKRQQNGQKPEAPPPMPPPPPTPYDEKVHVQMSFRVLTDEGEEKDLYTLSPHHSEEEKWTLPSYLKCAACQASAHQGAVAVADALRKRYKDDLVGVTTLEAMQDLCDNAGKWTQDYGLQPTKTGVNAITGPGITARQDELLDGNTDLMLQTQHSMDLGRKLGEACKEMLIGADFDEDELAAAVMEAEESADDDAGSRVFIEMLCEREGQACAAAAA